MMVQSDSQLSDLCAVLSQESVIFLDTEFVSEGRYYPSLGTIQIGGGEHIALIDVLTVQEMAPLIALLTDSTITKVFHACGQDLPIFYRVCGAPVVNIFDTQIAAALLGIDEQISFGNLVERVTGEHLQKSHSFTDWLRRPLTPGQIDYALDDVRYLVPIYHALLTQLHEQGRLGWAEEEFLRLEEEKRYLPPDPREQYLRLRGVERMNGRALSVLRELAAWREETARMYNLSLGRILRDEVLLELARRPRTTLRELREIRGMQQSQVDQYGQQLINLLDNDKLAPCPTLKRNSCLPGALEPTVDFLALCLRSLAGARGISSGMVATRGDLAALILSGDKADIPLMRGWRREAIGNALLATLQGQATARILPHNRQVQLDWNEAKS